MKHPAAGYNHTNNPNGGGKRGGNRGILAEAIRVRRERAEVRQTARDKRSAKKQLALLDGRPGESRRERARLAA